MNWNAEGDLQREVDNLLRNTDRLREKTNSLRFLHILWNKHHKKAYRLPKEDTLRETVYPYYLDQRLYVTVTSR